MEDPTIPLPLPYKSKKRLFAGNSSGNSSSSFAEPDVIEIPPPATWKSKPFKQKSIVDHEVIVLDGEDNDDVVIIEEKVAPNAKGKKPMPGYHSGDKAKANDGSPFVSANNFMKGSSSPCMSFIDDDFDFGGMDFAETLYDNECAMLQAHFDNVDIPSGVEATVPWWPCSTESNKQSDSATGSSVFGLQSNATINSEFSDMDQFPSWISHKPKPVKKAPIKKSPYKYTFHEPKFSPSGLAATDMNFHSQTSGMVPPEPHWPPAPDHGLKKKNKAKFVHSLHQIGVEYPLGWHHASPGSVNPYSSHMTNASSTSTFFSDDMLDFPVHDSSIRLDVGISAQISPPGSHRQGDDGENPFVKKLELFKKFDTLEDYSTHLYNKKKESCSQSKGWVNKIADEWRMLERDLPDTIFVRVFEARMDLLRAVIVGADGTPYHDGLFFFDVNFPPSYPSAPPNVKYHAHGLRINPNLYNCGKVCLSLLGTWSGSGAENWRPGNSNMLQVLLSIQGLILNAEPYYNEPGYESSRNSKRGQQQSKRYSENTFLLSLKTMLYTMRNPPKDFEDFVFGHFYTRANDVLAACRAYLDGTEVGSFDKSKSPADQVKGSNCSELLKMNLPTYIKSLVEAFIKIGVKDCEKYLVPIDKGANQPTKVGPSRPKSKLLKIPMAPGPGYLV